jgi:hypothetical protein
VRPARYGDLAPAVGASAFVLHEYLRPLHPAARERHAHMTKKNRRIEPAPAA